MPNRPDGLFTHSALIGVSGRLVVVGVGDETGDCADKCEGFNLEMRRCGLDVRFVESDEGVVLFVDVKVFDEAFAEEVVEGDVALLELLLGL